MAETALRLTVDTSALPLRGPDAVELTVRLTPALAGRLIALSAARRLVAARLEIDTDEFPPDVNGIVTRALAEYVGPAVLG